MLQFEQEENFVSQYKGECCGCRRRGLISGLVRHSGCWSWRARISRFYRDVSVEKLQRIEEKARLENPESVCIETACVAADLGVQSSVVFREFITDGDKRPMPGECAAITVDEADEYVDVIESSTPLQSDMEFEGFTFRESVSYACLKDLSGVLDTSGFPLLKVLINLIFTLL